MEINEADRIYPDTVLHLNEHRVVLSAYLDRVRQLMLLGDDAEALERLGAEVGDGDPPTRPMTGDLVGGHGPAAGETAATDRPGPAHAKLSGAHGSGENPDARGADDPQTRHRQGTLRQGLKADLSFTLFRDIEPEPRKDWLVQDFLGAGELSCFYGQPGAGKS